jgi:hypothetical protein
LRTRLTTRLPFSRRRCAHILTTIIVTSSSTPRKTSREIPSPIPDELAQMCLEWWSRGDSNPWPPPCKSGTIHCKSFLELAKPLQKLNFLPLCLSRVFRLFTQVAARLLHRRYGPLPHKIRHDRYSFIRPTATYESFVKSKLRSLAGSGSAVLVFLKCVGDSLLERYRPSLC